MIEHATSVPVDGLAPLTHDEAMALTATELDRTLDLLRSLDDDGWSAQTACPEWDVHRMYLHVLGACEAGASMRENAHQMRAGFKRRKADGGPLEAALSAVQVAERSDLTPTQLVDRLATIAPRTVTKRTSMPALLRKATMKVDGPVVERWSLGYLVDTIYLRDLWMHRIDAAQATGATLELTADHDGRIVADVVAEWARRHGQPFDLVLGGPAGGSFTARGTTGGADTTHGPTEHLELDAIDFCCTLAGRRPGDGLLTTIVPF